MELSISGESLKDTGFTSKSDPFCVVFVKDANGRWIEAGRTEIISNNLHPKWVNRVIVFYRFEEVQEIQFDVYAMAEAFSNNSTSKVDLRKQHHLGTCKSTLGQVLKNDGAWSGALQIGGNVRGRVTVRSEEVAASNTLCTIQLRCSSLVGGGWGRGLSPFFKLSKLREDGSEVGCYKSEVKPNNANPSFMEIKATAVQLANGDFYRPMKLEIFSYVNNGNHQYVGEVQISLNQLSDMSQNKSTLEIHNILKKGAFAGNLHCDGFVMTPQPTFIEYIKGGTQLSFMVAIDFTSSNLAANDQRSVKICASFTRSFQNLRTNTLLLIVHGFI